MKLKVKYYKRKKNGREYKQAWIGYSYRRTNGTPDFKRMISLAGLDEELVRGIDAVLRSGGELSEVGKVSFEQSVSIGAAWGAYELADQLGILKALDVLDEKYRIPVQAMIIDRVISARAHSKLALWETLPDSGLERVVAPESGAPANLHDFYGALSELSDNQKEIEKILFRQSSPADSSMYLYDITSSYMEGNSCELAEFGYNRDGKKGKQQIVIGLLTDSAGRPLSVEVFEGNTSDQTTVMSRIDSMRRELGIEEMVFVGDRGMITRARRNDLSADEYENVKYISALPRRELFQLLENDSHPLQPELFDRHNLVEVVDRESGTRYILSFNPEKEQEDRATRRALLEKTAEKLQMIKRNVESGRWKDEKVIAEKLHRWINHWNMERFFDCGYARGSFSFSLNHEKIKQYESLDGFYVIISDTDPEKYGTETTYRRYKSLIKVEQAFRTMKTTEIFLRPIRHWSAPRVKGHIFICMLAYLIIWEARNRLKEFISSAPANEEDAGRPEHSYHSLRTIWETLDKDMQIGKLKIGDRVTEQVCPIAERSRRILAALKATPGKKKIARLALM
jgi:transposase